MTGLEWHTVTVLQYWHMALTAVATVRIGSSTKHYRSVFACFLSGPHYTCTCNTTVHIHTNIFYQILIANAYRAFYSDVSVLRVWRWRSSGTWRRVTYWTIYQTTWRYVHSHRNSVPSLYNSLSTVLIVQMCTCGVESWEDHWSTKWNGFRTKRWYTTGLFIIPWNILKIRNK